MTTIRIKYCRPQILVTLLVAFSLLFSGVRVPDFSRPHRPRPTQRVVLETLHKTPSSPLKQHDNFVAVSPVPQESTAAVSYHALSRAVPSLYTSPASPAHSGRSPPAINS
jgi:hypothetical protein